MKETLRIRFSLTPQLRDVVGRLQQDTKAASLSAVITTALQVYDLLILEQQAGGKIIIKNSMTEKELNLL